VKNVVKIPDEATVGPERVFHPGRDARRGQNISNLRCSVPLWLIILGSLRNLRLLPSVTSVSSSP